MPAINHLSQEPKERLIKLLKDAHRHYNREKFLIILRVTYGKIALKKSKFIRYVVALQRSFLIL
jgi:hypothetical protein